MVLYRAPSTCLFSVDFHFIYISLMFVATTLLTKHGMTTVSLQTVYSGYVKYQLTQTAAQEAQQQPHVHGVTVWSITGKTRCPGCLAGHMHAPATPHLLPLLPLFQAHTGIRHRLKSPLQSAPRRPGPHSHIVACAGPASHILPPLIHHGLFASPPQEVEHVFLCSPGTSLHLFPPRFSPASHIILGPSPL